MEKRVSNKHHTESCSGLILKLNMQTLIYTQTLSATVCFLMYIIYIVSYTHLDVYKRQTLHNGKYRVDVA